MVEPRIGELGLAANVGKGTVLRVVATIRTLPVFATDWILE
jgi:hypothetical protein